MGATTAAGPCRGSGPRSGAAAAPPSRAPGCRASSEKGVPLAPAAAQPQGPAGPRRRRARGRLDALRRRAAAGAIDLVFVDESEARTHPYLARCWAKRGTDLRVQAPGQARRRAMLGAYDPARRRLLVRTSATKRSADFIALLDELGALYGGNDRRAPLIAVADNGPIHTSKLTTRALAGRPWLSVEWLPPYAPELNAIEHCWRDLKQHYLANRTFADAEGLDRAIHLAVDHLNRERQPHSSAPVIKAA